MNLDALFSDETSTYRIPSEPEPGCDVTIRFRTAKNDVSQVYLVHGDQEIVMEKEETEHAEEWFEYYTCTITVNTEIFEYYFEIISGTRHIFYDHTGVVSDRIGSRYPFRIAPGFSTPKWSQGALMYQIYVDRFCNGDPTNDPLTNEYIYIKKPVTQVKDWEALPEAFDVGRFYGGDLQGVRKKLDYLQGLGIDVIYFNPLFVSPSNHKYDSQDYDHIDPHFAVLRKDEGELVERDATDNLKASRYVCRVTERENLEASDAYFAELVEEIHRRGMRVILDGVFNHCGSFHKWLDREKIYERGHGYAPGAYASEKSPYHDYFSFKEKKWPDNDSYEGWWDHNTLPKLNYEESEALCEDILRVAKKWVSPPYNVDGWRLDVAADLGHSLAYNHRFWQRFRKVVKEANPEAIILAEHYEDPSPWLQGNEWDSVMNYEAFMEPLTWFLTGMEKHSDERRDELYGNGDWFFRTMFRNMSKFHRGSLNTAMNELSNHDHSRFLTRTNRMVGRVATAGAAAAGQGIDKNVFRMAVMVQMTWPGAPTIYYGDEAGMVGWTDPDNRRTYPWGKEDLELVEFHRYMIGNRKEIACLRTGSIKPLLSGVHLICYGRFEGNSRAVVLVNNQESARQVSIPVWQIGLVDGEMARVIQTTGKGYNVGRVNYTIREGMLDIEAEPMSAMLLCTDLL